MLRVSRLQKRKVDAHIFVCAFARDTLLRTSRLAEEHSFEVVMEQSIHCGLKSQE
ncbi:MAG: hypothetical protein QW595_03330 [Candidatus Bathyarchaeia archaeon]